MPSRLDGDTLYGCGTTDMKSGVAVMLRVAHLVGTGALDPRVDLTWVFYDCEEVEASRNGLGRLARDAAGRSRRRPGDPARAHRRRGRGRLPGDAARRGADASACARTARARGSGTNAIHAAAPVLARLAAYEARVVDVDGLTYREGLNAVGITGGVAGNVIPDECTVTVNYRFAPDRSEDDALAHVRDVFAGFDVRGDRQRAGCAVPGSTGRWRRSSSPRSAAQPRAKLGWTDVARFGQLGIPAVNFGPGDPNLAHKPEEHVAVQQVLDAETALVRFLS